MKLSGNISTRYDKTDIDKICPKMFSGSGGWA